MAYRHDDRRGVDWLWWALILGLALGLMGCATEQEEAKARADKHAYDHAYYQKWQDNVDLCKGRGGVPRADIYTDTQWHMFEKLIHCELPPVIAPSRVE